MRLLSSLVLICSLSAASLSCKSKKAVDKKFFPALSYIKSQVAKVDSSLNTIKKYVFIDSTRTDTIFLHRDQFKDAAADFLSIPDLTGADYQDRYTESNQYDETLNRAILICTPIKPGKEQVQRQEVLIKPDPGGDKVTNIIINTVMSSKDSSVEKHMLWKVDESFQVTTTRQLAGQPEKTSTYKVEWIEQ